MKKLVLGERAHKPYGAGSHIVPQGYLYDGNKKREVPENVHAIPPTLTYDTEIKKWRLDFYGMPPNGKGMELFSYYFNFETEVLAFLKVGTIKEINK